MPLEIAFYITDVAIKQEGVVLFGYTQDNKRVAVIDSTYLPFFFIPIEKLENYITSCKEHNINIEHFERLVNLAKIYVRPVDIVHATAHAKKLKILNFSADLPIKSRYWNVKGLKPFMLCKAEGETINKDYRVDITINANSVEFLDAQLQQPTIVAFDIETVSTKGSPNPVEDPIIFAAIYAKNFKKVLTWKRFEKAPNYVEFVNSESELIENFFKTLRDLKPHIIVGYGSDNFDLPYLLARAAKYKLDLSLNWDSTSIGAKKDSIHIVGPVYLDLSMFIHNILRLDVERYQLDFVSKKLLGKGKLAVLTAKKIHEMWSVGLPQELNFLAEYNLTDAELAYELCEKILSIQLELAKLVGLPLQTINNATYGMLVEWFIIKNSQNPIPAKPSKTEVFSRRRKSYRGGFVVEPEPGVYKNILAFDFRSLYPTIIASHNISQETMNCTCCGPQKGFFIEELGIWFCAKKEGLIPRLARELVERRKRIADILQQTAPDDTAFMELMARQSALKYIATALYGYFGYASSRFYNFDCARAVTALGRRYIKLTIKEAEKFGFKVLYGDTDSIFVQPIKEGIDAKTFLQIINSVLPKPMELEYKDKYLAGFFLGKKYSPGGAKKRYAMLTEKGSLILRGLEAIRGDWSPIAKKVQKEVLRILLTENDIEKAAIYLKKVLADLKQHKIAIEDLAIPSRLRKKLDSYTATSPRVAAAKLAIQKGYDISKWSAISYIIKSGQGKLSDRVTLLEDASLQECDVNYYIENQIFRAVYKIFETFGYDLEKLKEGQTTISSYGND
jgi:DNA polymerase elongation subunit (family B)